MSVGNLSKIHSNLKPTKKPTQEIMLEEDCSESSSSQHEGPDTCSRLPVLKSPETVENSSFEKEDKKKMALIRTRFYSLNEKFE